MSTPAPQIRVEVGGGDELGNGDQPLVSWQLPDGVSGQIGYRIVSDDGYDSGRIESAEQGPVSAPVFDRPRRRCALRVQVWTDGDGTARWSEPVTVDSGPMSDRDWTARWIAAPEDEVAPKGQRPAYWLRSTFSVSGDGPVLLYASALGVYELFLNGVRVGDEELAPGFTQYARRVQYQRHDVTELVRLGENVIAVLLGDGWYRGQVGMPRAADQFGTSTALRIQLETSSGSGDGVPEVLAASAPDWLTAPSHIRSADLIGGQSEDRRAIDPAVHSTEIATAGWRSALAVTTDARTVRAIAPPIRRVETIAPLSVRTVGNDCAQLVDLGQNINGWLRLSELGPAGTALTIRHGEHLDPGGDLSTSHLDVNLPIIPEPLPLGQVDQVVSGGVAGDVFEPRFTTHGFRYARVEGLPSPLDPTQVSGVVVHSDLARTGWFSCSDEAINRLHEAAVWSMRSNISGIPTDCPQRERAGWTGDWQIFAPTSAYLYDVLAFTRSWLRDVRLDQRADGCITNMSPCPPAEGFDSPLGGLNGSAGWGDAIVSVPWDLYQIYGDPSLLAENWEAMCRWVDFAAGRAASGRHPDRVAARPDPAEHERYLWDTGFHWGEWLEPGAEIGDFRMFAGADKSEVATAYLYRSAQTVADVARILHRPVSAVDRYQKVADGARQAWQREYIDDQGRLAVQTQASHVRALSFGLLPEELCRPAAERLAQLVSEAGGTLTTGFLSTGLLLPALTDHGQLDVAYALLFRRQEPSWLTMIDRGATTLWERWNGVDAEGHAHDSLNHYSKGAVISFLHRHVAGISPSSPGYRKFRVAPRPGGGIDSARAEFDSRYGRISLDWRVVDGTFSLELDVPPSTTAEVMLPDGRNEMASSGRHRYHCLL